MSKTSYCGYLICKLVSKLPGAILWAEVIRVQKKEASDYTDFLYSTGNLAMQKILIISRMTKEDERNLKTDEAAGHVFTF